MTQIENINKNKTRRSQMPMRHQCSIFLQLYSREIKYMNPWVQYDDDGSEKNSYNSTNINVEFEQQIHVQNQAIEKAKIADIESN